jgi:hypothetical protein
MINPEDTFFETACELDLHRDDDSANGLITLSEEGELAIQFEEGEVEPFTDFHHSWSMIEGRDQEGRHVRVEKATAQQRNFSLVEIRPTSICIYQNEDYAPSPDDEIVIDFDILCFLPQIPPRNQVDTTTRDTIEKLSDDEDRPMPDIPEEFEVPYVKEGDYEAYGVPLTDTTDRRDYIRDTGRKARTAKIRIKQHTHGDITHRVDKATEVVNKILELSQLVQEVTPQFVRGKVVSINDSSVANSDIYYELLRSGGGANVGAGFSQYPDKVLWGNFHEYINKAYENYTHKVRDRLRLRQVLGYYVDARNPNRPVEGKMLSVCSAIELLALWHAREDGVSEKTGEKIKHLVEKLDVETKDLALESVPDTGDLDIPEYFWKRERNYVSHGDPNVETSQLIDAYGATIVLLKRIIRNQLLGTENESFQNFYSMTPRPSVEFDG